MNNDDDIAHLLRSVDFSGEPPMASATTDDIRRGQRSLRHRRIAAYTTGIAATAVVGAGVAFAIPSETPGGQELGVAGSSDSSESETTTSTSDKAEDAPQDEDESPAAAGQSALATEMSEGEFQEHYRECVDTGDSSWAAFEPVLGMRADVDADANWAATAWVLGHDGELWLTCDFDSSGQVQGTHVFGGPAVNDIPYLFAPADPVGLGVGRYTSDIARVTVQVDDGPEQDAALRDGFWFVPLERDPRKQEVEEPENADSMSDEEMAAWMDEHSKHIPDDNLINVSYSHIIRGYDESGELVYDSSTDGPSIDDCYTDPDGNEVIGNYDVDSKPDPEGCRKTFSWDH